MSIHYAECGNTVSYEEYENERKAFFEKHKNRKPALCHTYKDELDRHYKEYTFKDGAKWFEIGSPYYAQNVKIDINGVKINIGEVELFEVEYHSTDSPDSKFFYEKY